MPFFSKHIVLIIFDIKKLLIKKNLFKNITFLKL